MSLTKEVILELISGSPKSKAQIARELGIEPDESKNSQWAWLGESLDELKFQSKLVDTAVTQRVEGGGVVDDNTYRYYRRDEAAQLGQRGILGPVREVDTWRGLQALAVLTGSIILRRDNPILNEGVDSRPQPKSLPNRKR